MTASPTPAIFLRFALGLLALACLPCLARQLDAQSVPAHAPAHAPSHPAPSVATGSASASTPSTPSPAPPPTGPLNRFVVVLDPAHGGLDSGSRIGDSILEKDVTLALADKLRSLLSARGFTVVMTRDSDAAPGSGTASSSASSTAAAPPSAPLTLDDRAGLANHARAAACLSLHATAAGQGVHLYSSELPAAPAESNPLPWLTAQAAWVPQSRALERHIGDALTRAGIPLVLSSASVRPVDSLTCPALVIEIAPRSDNPASIDDSSYQQRIAQAIAGALLFWRDQDQPPPRLAAASAPTPARASAPQPAADPGARP